jgi:hypothetical protein
VTTELPPSPTSYFTSLHSTELLTTLLRSLSLSLSLCYDQQPVGQSVLEQSPHLGFKTRSLLLSDSCGFVDVGRSLTRGRVCRLKLLLALISAVILRSESRGTRDQMLLSQIRDFPFRRLLRLAGLRWRYSTPLHTGFYSGTWLTLFITFQHEPHRKHRFHYYSPTIRRPLHRNGCLFSRLLHSNSCCL